MVAGYGRVSSKEQNLARQEVALKGVDRVYLDKSTGRNMERVEFKRMIQSLREGDTVTVVSIDRLGRDSRELINVSYDLQKMGVNIVSIKEGVDTSTPMGKIFYTLIAVFAELELNNIHERQRAGIEAAKREGRFTGRPPKKLNDDFKQINREVQEGKLTVARACKLLGISVSTYYRRKATLDKMPEKEDNHSEDDVINFGLSEETK